MYMRVAIVGFDARELQGYDPSGAAAELVAILDRYDVRAEPFFTARDIGNMHRVFQDAARGTNEGCALLALPPSMPADRLKALEAELQSCQHVSGLRFENSRPPVDSRVLKTSGPEPSYW